MKSKPTPIRRWRIVNDAGELLGRVWAENQAKALEEGRREFPGWTGMRALDDSLRKLARP